MNCVEESRQADVHACTDASHGKCSRSVSAFLAFQPYNPSKSLGAVKL